MRADTRIIVAGGGVIGLSIAWRMARRGHQVTVVDPAPASGASWVAGGMLAPVAEAYRGEEAITALGLASVERWPEFVGQLAADAGCGVAEVGYTTAGSVVVARDRDDAEALRDLFAHQQACGLRAEQLSSRELRRLEPSLAPGTRGGLWLPDDHQVDNRLLLGALRRACDASGVRLVPASVAAAGSTRVITDDGVRIAGDAVVVATGARSPHIDAGHGDLPDGAGLRVPVRPVKGQIVRVRSTPGAVFPTCTVRGLDVYIIPRAHGEIAIGATSEEQGYDTSVTAGAVRSLLDEAWQVVPALAEAEFVEAVAGLRPGSPDNLPIIGRWFDHGGPLLAMGHYRHGVLLAPVTADAVVGQLEGRLPPSLHDVLAPADPRRFSAVLEGVAR